MAGGTSKGKPPVPNIPTKALSKKVPKKKPVKNKQKLNIRERLFIKGLLEGLTATEAMRRAGYKESTALAKQSEKLEKVGDALHNELEKAGCTDTLAAQRIFEGMSAEKQISCNVIINQHLTANEQNEMRPAHEMTKDFVDVVDFKERREYTKLYLELKGHLNKQEINLAGAGGAPLHVTVNFVKAAVRVENNGAG